MSYHVIFHAFYTCRLQIKCPALFASPSSNLSLHQTCCIVGFMYRNARAPLSTVIIDDLQFDSRSFNNFLVSFRNREYLGRVHSQYHILAFNLRCMCELKIASVSLNEDAQAQTLVCYFFCPFYFFSCSSSNEEVFYCAIDYKQIP